ncbi:DUF2341 domain-containing protein [Mucilaginibacter sp.]|uniref:DUF2341 domain-containing protein n=1 Tax=Mucilaginibacter sp. TaxID=1882438 RepID=UPI003D0FB4ED
MNKRILRLHFILLFFIVNVKISLAQTAPVITYTPASSVFTAGTPITTLSPGNSGGAVSPANYAAPTTFVALNQAYGIYIDGSNNIFAVDGSTGGDLYKYSTSATGGTINTTLNSPDGVTADGLGNLYVSDFNNNVYRINASTGVVTATITGFNAPYGIAIDASNNVYIANSGGNNILKIAAGATTTTVYATGFTSPYGIAIDASGNLFVSQNTSTTVIKVAAGTGTRTTYSGFNGPRGLSVDAFGNVTVADYGNNVVKRISAGGTITTILTGLNAPRQVDYDSSGNMYIADYGSNTIKRSLATSYSISATLPAGLSFSTSTGQITGTPTVPTASTNYTITGYNTGGSSAFVENITVNPAAPTVSSNGSNCVGSALLTAAGGSPTGGTYNWYNVATGGTALQSSTSTTYSPPSTATYYVSYTVSGVTSARTSIAATVTALPTAGTFTATSTVYTGNTATVTLTSTYNAALTYSWDFNGGTPSTGTGAGPFGVSWSTAGTKTITLTVTNSSGCAAVSTQTVTVTGVFGTYAFSKPLVLNTSSISNGGITTTLTNFPALVYIQDNNLKIGSACADKVQYPLGNYSGSTAGTNYDFAFTVVGGSTELNYQVENYDPVGGTLLVWVQVPSITSTNTNLTLYFGSLTPAHGTTFTQSTWSSDYQAVYHFNEGSASATVIDATSNGRSAAQTNTTVAAGQITGAYQFDGTSSKIISVGTSNNVTSSFTLSAWVKPTAFNLSATSGGYDHKIITNEAVNYTTAGYKLGLYGSSATTVYPEVETRPNGGSPASLDRSTSNTQTAVSLNTWHYVQGVYNSSNSTFYSYLDGKLNFSSTGAVASGTTGQNIYLGSDFSASNYLQGILDEARISNVVKSSDWIKAEYYNQTNPLTFTNYSGAVTAYQANATGLNGALVYTWSGAASTDMAVAGNWNNTTSGTLNQLPALTTGTSTLNIPASVGNYPSLSANASLYGLNIASGASLNLNGFTLNVGCNIYNSATTGGTGILYGGSAASAINWNGTSATQTYTGNGVANTFETGDMTINNTYASGATISFSGGPVELFDKLTLTKGNLSIASTTTFTLMSSANLTASVSQVSPYTISGIVNVQRFITGSSSSAYRGYRLLSSPVNLTSATSGSANYIDFSTLKSNYTAGATKYYGAFTAGTGGVGGGFSVYNANPTIYLYNETLNPSVSTKNLSFVSGKNVGVTSISGSTVGITSTINGVTTTGSVNVPVGNGYLLFFIGSSNPAVRTTGTTAIAPDDAVITNVGYLNQQNVTVNLWYTPGGGVSNKLSYSSAVLATNYPGYNTVGNPYASTIDLQKLYNDNKAASPSLSPNFYELNDKNPNQAYVVYSATGGNSGSVYSQYVASGQGFIARVTATGQALVFQEDQKIYNTALLTSSSSPPSLLIASKPLTVLKGLHLKLEQVGVYNDECGVYFDNKWNDKYDIDDAYDLDGVSSKVYISTYTSDSVRTAINKLSDFNKNKKVRIFVKATTDGVYNLTMTDIANIDTTLYNVFLLDHYKKDSLDMRRYKSYAFDIKTADTNSFGANRFELAIERLPVPPYHILSFTAQKVSNGVLLTWKTNNEGDYTGFGIEKQDGSNATYKSLYNVQSDGNGTYTYVDNSPVKGNNTYRLMQNDIDNNTTYTNPLNVLYNSSVPAGSSGVLTIYPNPAKQIITVNFNSSSPLTSNVYDASIYNAGGVLVMKKSVNGNSWSQDVEALKPGAYVLEMKNSSGALLGNAKFVKIQ